MRLPDDTQRLNLYGKTGSGKTVAGLWHLSKRHFDKRPWVLVDFKRDDIIADIPGLEEIDPAKAPPKEPGLYVIRPFPGDDIDSFLWKVWEKKNTGLYIDEGASIDRFSKAFDAICTQGRSLRIPLITCSQRPSWLGRYVMSEADFHQVFYLHNPADVQRIADWVPGIGPMRQDYHSWYYDVGANEISYLAPVPDKDDILNRFDMKVPKRMRFFDASYTAKRKIA